VKVNSGNDVEARCLGGDVAGDTGTSTGTTSTTLTDSGKSWTTNAFAGHVVATGGVYGVVLSNTGTALTVDRWYAPATPGGAAGSTPSTGTYVILPGGAPAWFMAITANSTSPSASDTTLAGEITTAGGGLVRKLATYAHTAGASTYTLTATFTANGSDSLPVTVAKMGVFNSISSGLMLHETLLNATATLTASGDACTVSQTVTM
jgi:hypothetical protein